jgi:hypothetical protein
MAAAAKGRHGGAWRRWWLGGKAWWWLGVRRSSSRVCALCGALDPGFVLCVAI